MLARLLAVFLILVTPLALDQALAAESSNTITLRDRVVVASKIYHQISTFFPDLSQKQFDQDYGDYLAAILTSSDDRRTFDLASMALVATLHDGRTWFFDKWFEQNYGKPVGLTVYPWDHQWVVVRSELELIRVGDPDGLTFVLGSLQKSGRHAGS